MKVLALSRYGQLGASSRMRIAQYVPHLESEGISITLCPLFDDEQLQLRYAKGGYSAVTLISAYRRRIFAMLHRREFDLLWIEKEALPWFPARSELALLRGVPFVLDYDDAVFHNYDLHRRLAVRKFLGKRLDTLMAHASLVVVGNDYLADRARAAGAPLIAGIPTVVDLDRYSANRSPLSECGEPPRIVWIGSPTTTDYLGLVVPALQNLARRYHFIVRLIGAGQISIPGVHVELMKWSSGTEAQQIGECDIGIMPLRATPWELGKCSYKLVQYMAAGLPCVASSVGANNEVVSQGVTGFLVHESDGWIRDLEILLQNPDMRRRMGSAGRARVESSYSLQKSGSKLALLLQQVVVERRIGARI